MSAGQALLQAHDGSDAATATAVWTEEEDECQQQQDEHERTDEHAARDADDEQHDDE